MSKSKNKICIIHFQPLEKYPPITNLLNYLSAEVENITIFSTKNAIGLPLFKNKTVQIVRYPAINEKAIAIIRLIQYLFFYIGTLYNLLGKRPQKILYYETLSSFPAIIYYYLSFKRVQLMVHYHEYCSPEEYQADMFLSRWFHRLEQHVYPKATWLSHTNHKRLKMFLQDNPAINHSITRIIPNYPPSWWSKKTNQNKTIRTPLKIVFVGAVSMDTMYFNDFFDWVIKQQGKVLFDVYSFVYSQDFLSHVKSLNNPYISLKGKLEYNQFPNIMNDYHIGVILYKGHLPNYVYNAPNKLFEYLACGLDVWVSDKMESSRAYVTRNTYPKVMMLDYKNMDTFDLENAISRNGMSYQPSAYFFEPIYSEIKKFMVDA